MIGRKGCGVGRHRRGRDGRQVGQRDGHVRIAARHRVHDLRWRQRSSGAIAQMGIHGVERAEQVDMQRHDGRGEQRRIKIEVVGVGDFDIAQLAGRAFGHGIQTQIGARRMVDRYQRIAAAVHDDGRLAP